MKGWQYSVIRDAADQRDASYAQLARWSGVHVDTLRKARKRDREFAQAIENARQGRVAKSSLVDIREFVRSPDYLGLGVEGQDEGGTVWPVVIRELEEINSDNYDLVILSGSLGAAKTYVASISLVYQLYKLLSIRDPHAKYGLDPASTILCAVQNRSRKLSERNDYALVRNLIERSDWFSKNAPFDDRLRSRIKFLKCNVEVWAASGDAADLLGMNLHSLVLDEANFFQRTDKSKRAYDGGTFDAGREAFESALRRKQSRFPDHAGLFFVASSKRFKGQLTDELSEEFASDARTYVYDHSQWSIRPELYKNSDWFNVFKGDRLRPPRILNDDETLDSVDRGKIMRVPERFKRRFKSDPVRSLQDIAGVSTEISGAFFSDKEAVGLAASLKQNIVSMADAEGDATQLLPTAHSFDLPCDESPRHCHADLSLTGDLTGIAVGHIRRYNSRGLPEIDVDCVARVRPPRAGQIELDSVYRLVAGWKQARIPINWFSADGYQSADLLQRIQRLGVKTGRLSVDQTTPTDPTAAYECLRAAISEGRFRFPDDGETVDDLLWLQADYEKRRVDHLPNRKKDTCDALAAIAYFLTHKIEAFRFIGKIEGAGFAAATAHPKLGGQVTSIPARQLTGVDLLRLQRGEY